MGEISPMGTSGWPTRITPHQAQHRGRIGAGREGPGADAVDPELQRDQVGRLLGDQHADLRIDVALTTEAQVRQVQPPATRDDGRPDPRRTVGAHAVREGTAVGNPARTLVGDRVYLRAVVGLEPGE